MLLTPEQGVPGCITVYRFPRCLSQRSWIAGGVGLWCDRKLIMQNRRCRNSGTVKPIYQSVLNIFLSIIMVGRLCRTQNRRYRKSGTDFLYALR